MTRMFFKINFIDPGEKPKLPHWHVCGFLRLFFVSYFLIKKTILHG